MPLIIGRATGEGILIVCPNGDEIIVDVDRIQKNYVKLAIIADRKYLLHRIVRNNEDRIYQQPAKRHDNPMLRSNGMRQDGDDCHSPKTGGTELRQGTRDSENNSDTLRRDSN